MFVVLSPAHPDPMYKQVTDQIKDAIASGDLKPNDRLPSVRELSEALNVSAITIKRAYQDLETEGFILTRAGTGLVRRARWSATPCGSASSRSCRRSCAGWSGPARSSASRRATSSGSPGRSRGTDMDTVLEATDLTKHYEDFSLRGVSLTVRRGSDLGDLRPERGRQVHAAADAGRPDAGADGHAPRARRSRSADAERDLKNRIGYVPQEPVFYENQTVEWHARFVAPYFARWDGAGFYRLLDEFKVNPLKKVKHLSGGQKKLLSMAFALSHDAELLILDEPTAGLDIVHRRSMLDRLRALANGGETTVIVASHITDGLDEIAEDIWFLDDGRVVAHEDKDDLLARWKWVHFKDGALPKAIEEGLVAREAAAIRQQRTDRRLPQPAGRAGRPARERRRQTRQRHARGRSALVHQGGLRWTRFSAAVRSTT